MSTLYLLRHAKAVPQDPDGDAARALAERGRKAAAAMGRFLATLAPAPVLVLCSTSRRTRQTLDLVVPFLAEPPQLLFEEGLYLAEARQLLTRLRRVPAGTASVLLVGHNPGMQELAARLAEGTGGPASRLETGFPTAALAEFELEAPWAELGRRRARLVRFVTPKEL
jgi:phosphohistidine phosphatase